MCFVPLSVPWQRRVVRDAVDVRSAGCRERCTAVRCVNAYAYAYACRADRVNTRRSRFRRLGCFFFISARRALTFSLLAFALRFSLLTFLPYISSLFFLVIYNRKQVPLKMSARMLRKVK